MAYSLVWMRQVLLDANLRVAEQPGWTDRGRAEMGQVKGVMCHHTAGPAMGNMPSLGVLTNGRAGLRGPLCHIGLGRDGTFYLIAAGRANHAGVGYWEGITTGNANFIGIEAENTGQADDLWPAVQMDAYRHGVAALLRKIGADAVMCCGHREYALPPGRKIDPSFDMADFRNKVAAILAGVVAPPAFIAASDGQPTLARGAIGPKVITLRQKLRIADASVFDGITEAAVRDFQRKYGLVPDGIVGPKTWAALDNS